MGCSRIIAVRIAPFSLAAAIQIFLCLNAVGAGTTAPREKSAPKEQAAREPEGWLNTFQIKRGFRLELVASEALVSAPAAMAFDENGRLFVAEMRDYPNK